MLTTLTDAERDAYAARCLATIKREGHMPVLHDCKCGRKQPITKLVFGRLTGHERPITLGICDDCRVR